MTDKLATPDTSHLEDANTNFFYCLATAWGELPKDAVIDLWGDLRNPEHQKRADKNRLLWHRLWWAWLQDNKALYEVEALE